MIQDKESDAFVTRESEGNFEHPIATLQKENQKSEFEADGTTDQRRGGST